MENNELAKLLVIVLGIMFFILIVLVAIFLFLRFKSRQNSTKQNSDNKEITKQEKSKVQQMYNVQSIFNFMEFDKIEDNMIVQKQGKRFLMIVKCQGINYDLMSGVEKSSVEQGFLQYLNSLRYPIQIYVETRTVDLTGSIENYKQRVRTMSDNLANKEYEYNKKIKNGQTEELDKDKYEIAKARNLYEYGNDIVSNTERMSLNRNILTKNYYIILAYYPEEAGNSIYSKEEVSNFAFSELYTRSQSTISLLSVCGINSKILDSTELADLLYSTYNRDEAEIYDLNRAINSGYDSLYITAPDVLDKRMKELDKQMEVDAIKKANDAIDEVVRETEKEKELKRKEKEYSDIVNKLAGLFIDENEDVIGKEVAKKAKEKVTGKKTEKKKEESVNVQEKATRTRRIRRTA